MNKTVTAGWSYRSFNNVIKSFVPLVTDAVEIPKSYISGEKFEIDIGDDWIEFRFYSSMHWTDTLFNGWTFLDTLDAIPDFTNYYIESMSAGITNFDASDVGWNAEQIWADFADMHVAGPGEYIRMKVEAPGIHISVKNFVAGETGTVLIGGATDGGQVGIAYSLNGPGPISVNTGVCGLMTVDLNLPINVLGYYSAVGGNVNLPVNIPLNSGVRTLWIQALDVSTCQLTNRFVTRIN